MKIRDRVCRKDAPGIVGTVIAKDGERFKVYWSSHTSQWIDSAALMQAPRVTEKGRP
jgi:hypothetical protein